MFYPLPYILACESGDGCLDITSKWHQSGLERFFFQICVRFSDFQFLFKGAVGVYIKMSP